MVPSRGSASRGVVLAVSLALLSLAACSGTASEVASSPSVATSSTSGSGSPSPSPTPTPTVNQAVAFCEAAKEWSQSPAQRDLQAALVANDNAAATAAFKEQTAPTKAMLASLPSTAPTEIRVAFEQFTSTIEEAGSGSFNANELANFRAASQQVTTYVGTECAPTPSSSGSESPSGSASESPSDSTSASPSDSESSTDSSSAVPESGSPELAPPEDPTLNGDSVTTVSP